MHGDTCIGIFVKSMVEGGAAHVVRITNPTCDIMLYYCLFVCAGWTHTAWRPTPCC